MTAAGTPGEEEPQAPWTEPGVVAAQPAEAGAGAERQEAAGDEPGRDVIDLLEPADGLPSVIATAQDLAAAVARLAAGTGPVAVDAERASGYRYGQRAYLVQLRRAGAGTVLIDPIACPDLSGLGAALGDVEAVLHAASQDLPCLAEIGYQPRELFDTELAGRLLGYPRVALGTDARGSARLPAGEGALGRGLVGAAAARGDAQVRGARRRGADRAARRARRPASRAGQDRVGPRRSSPRSRPLPAAATGRPVAAHVGNSPGAHQAGPRGRAGAVADAGRDRPRRRPVTTPDAERPGHRRRRAWAEAAKPPPTGRPQLERISGFHARYARGDSDRWAAAVLPRPRARRRRASRGRGGAAAVPGPRPRIAGRSATRRRRPG